MISFRQTAGLIEKAANPVSRKKHSQFFSMFWKCIWNIMRRTVGPNIYSWRYSGRTRLETLWPQVCSTLEMGSSNSLDHVGQLEQPYHYSHNGDILLTFCAWNCGPLCHTQLLPCPISAMFPGLIVRSSVFRFYHCIHTIVLCIYPLLYSARVYANVVFALQVN